MVLARNGNQNRQWAGTMLAPYISLGAKVVKNPIVSKDSPPLRQILSALLADSLFVTVDPLRLCVRIENRSFARVRELTKIR